MPLQTQTIPHILITAGCALGSIILAKICVSELSKCRKFNKIPTFGSTSWLGSLWVGGKYEKDLQTLIQEGYEKYKSKPFKVADGYRWVVVLGSRQHIEELRHAPDDKLSFLGAVNDIILIKFEYTMGSENFYNPYHFNIVRSQLTRGLYKLYPDIQDEVSTAFEEILDLGGNGWKTVSALTIAQKVTCRASQRIFVGLPLCREADWIDLNLRYTLDVMKTGSILGLFPGCLSPLVSRFITDVADGKKCAIKYLTPIIEERQKILEDCGNNWDGKPNDLLSWLMDEAPEGMERTIAMLTSRMLAVSFSSVHPVSNTFAHALLFLAANPQYIQPLREEVETVVGNEGWTKVSLAKMYKIDSFIKESQRSYSLAPLGLLRLAVKDFTFSDGTFIPKEAAVTVASRARQLDEELYENAKAFCPFRFSDIRGQEPDESGCKHDLVSTSVDFLLFGHGKNACPGRFLAAVLLKCMLGLVILSYDVKLEDDTTTLNPSKVALAYRTVSVVDPAARVMFRRRAY